MLLAIAFNTGSASGGVSLHALDDGGTGVAVGGGGGVGVGSPTGSGVESEIWDHDVV